jgi:predicted helicase
MIEIKKAVKDNLISDLDDDSFCDLLSQTIAYGFFATYIAFLEDPNTLPSYEYTLESVLYYMPPGNKFIQSFFKGIVKNLVNVSEEDAIKKSIKGIYKSVKSFSFNQEEISNWEWERKGSLLTMSYEMFLESYDKEKRKSLGAWYTPEYIVDHIIRFSHYLLINKLNIENGFLNEEYSEKKQSKLQILDPATGTGNFLTRLAESICLSSNVVVNSNNRKDANFYIDDHLINKLNGFELSMLSYIIANFNLDNVFRKFGYNNRGVQRQRTNIYLTNTLDNSVVSIDENVQGFERLLAKETEAANVIKNEKPVFVVIGNPPYNGASKNNSKFIVNENEKRITNAKTRF